MSIKKIIYSIIIAVLLSIGFTTSLVAHEQWVHQYIVIEAFKLLKQQYPAIQYTAMAGRIGGIGSSGSDYPYDDWQYGSITAGAWREDVDDPVEKRWGTASVTMTHFWDADVSDSETNAPIGSAPYKNSYIKAAQYYGEMGANFSLIDLYDPDTKRTEKFTKVDGGTIEIPHYGIVFSIDGLINLYRTGKIKIIGFWGLSGRDRNRPDFADPAYHRYSSPIEVYAESEHISDMWISNRVDRIVWEVLGRISHSIGDMSVPAHVHEQAHICQSPFNDPEKYEIWMGSNDDAYNCPPTSAPANFHAQNWSYLHPEVQKGLIDVSGKAYPIRFLMYTTNQITDHFPCSDADGSRLNIGDNNYYSGSNGGSNIYRGDDYSIITNETQSLGNPPSTVDNVQIADKAFTYAIRATAGLLHLFAIETGMLPYPINLSQAQYIGSGSGGTYKVNGTNVGTSWSGTIVKGQSIEAVTPSEYLFLNWSDGSTQNPRTVTGSLNVYAVYQSPISGPITNPTTWSGTVNVTGNVIVSNGATLTILPGTNVLLGSNVKIDVWSGKIIADGTQGTIRFKQLNSGQRWDRIRLASNNNQFLYCIFDGGTENVFLACSENNIFSYCSFKNASQCGVRTEIGSNSSFDNCVFEANSTGIVLWHAGLTVKQSTIRNNTPGAGIAAYYSMITNFTDNKVENNAGGGIVASAGSTIYLGNGTDSYNSDYHQDIVATAGAGKNRIKNNGNSYQLYVDVDSRLYVGSLVEYDPWLIAGYNKISATSNLYIYNLAMTGEYENQQQWVVPAHMTWWGENGSVSASNFTGEVDYNYPLIFDPSASAGASGTVPLNKVTNPANENKPITVLTSAIAAKISSTQPTSSQGKFLVDLKNKMIKVRNDFNDPQNKKFRPRLLGNLNGLSLFDPNDATQEKGMINTLLAEYRERLITNKSTTDSTERLCNEAALVSESQNALRNGDIAKVQELLKTYGPYVKNKDNVRSLLFAEMSVYERGGDYAKAWEKLGAIKAIKPNDDLKKIYVAPSYKIMEERLQEKAKAAGIVLSKQESTEEEQQNTANEQQQPKEISLQNYPNPFNPSTVVSYQLSAVSNVKLSIFDIRGREVEVLADGMKQAGHYSATFDASRLSSGIYFSRLTVHLQEGKSIVLAKKMLLMK